MPSQCASMRDSIQLVALTRLWNFVFVLRHEIKIACEMRKLQEHDLMDNNGRPCKTTYKGSLYLLSNSKANEGDKNFQQRH